MSTIWEPYVKKLTTLCAVALAAMLAGLAVLAFQSSAQAYPEIRIELTAEPQELYGGETFTATATSDGTSCTWNLAWHGEERRSGATQKFVTTYTAPDVTEVTDIPLHGTCSYEDTAVGSTARSAATWERTLMIRVLPVNAVVSPPTGSGSDLPNTGGPNKVFLLGGLALLVSGATAVFVARRRAEEAELVDSRF